MTGYEGLDSPTSPKYGSPKYSEETVTCDSDGKHDNDYIKGKEREIKRWHLNFCECNMNFILISNFIL